MFNQHQSQLSLPFLWGKYIKYWSVWMGLKRGGVSGDR